jgi:hypothetical protein
MIKRSGKVLKKAPRNSIDTEVEPKVKTGSTASANAIVEPAGPISQVKF